MAISLLLLTASAVMWHLGQRGSAEHSSSSSRATSLASTNHLATNTSSSTAAAPATTSSPGKAAAKPTNSYVLRNTAQTFKQLERNDRALLLRNALIDTTSRTKLAIPAHLRSDGAPGAYIVQSYTELNPAFYAELGKDGAQYISYIPTDAVLVKASSEVAQTLATDPKFAAVLPYEPYYKLDASLLPEAVNQTLMVNNTLRITVYPGETDSAVQSLNALGAHVFGQDSGPFGTTLVALVPPDKLVAVAQMPQAQEIESYSPRHLANDLVRERLGVATNQTISTDYLGLTGSNIWLSVNDSGADNSHPDLANRVAYDTPNYQILSTDTNGHGTHVVGTIIGSGAQSTTVTNNIPGSGVPVADQFRGMAPQGNVYLTAVDPLTGPFVSDSYLQTNAYTFLQTTTAGSTVGVTNGFIANNSWGYGDTLYDSMAASYDEATRKALPNSPGEQAMLFVFAAGDNYQVPNTITSPGTAKNVLTVGAIQSFRNISNVFTVPIPLDSTNLETNSFFLGDTDGSNQVASLTAGGNVDIGTEGPSGRYKPDVVSPGIFVVSDRSIHYQDPTNLAVTFAYEWPGPTTGPAISPGQTNIYAINIPPNTSNLLIQLVPNAQSPLAFPSNFQFYLNTTNTFGPGNQIIQSNAAGLALVVNPTGTNSYIGVYEPAGNIQPVGYDLYVYLITNAPYGTYYSTLSNLNSALSPYYRYESGTSMAAASISGMLADMQQFLTSQMHIMPSPALLKAMVINGARPLNDSSDLSPSQALNLEGWGLPNLTNSIPASLATNGTSSMVFYDQSPTNTLQTGQWHNYQVTLGANATNSPLRFTLVWTDPPGNPAAGIALVNNLDLMVADTTGTNLYIGNDFPLGGGEAGIFTQASPTNTADASDIVNNVENVYLDSILGLQTTYFVSVRGTRIPVNAVTTQTNGICQDFALVISSDDQTSASGLIVQDMGVTTVPLTNFAIVSSWTNTNAITLQPVTAVTSGMPLLHQRVGGNEPNLWNPYVANGTNGNPLQWHFFVMTNTVTATNTNLTLAVFTTFLPPSLTLNTAPANTSVPANNNADIDLYVSTDSNLTNLTGTAVANSFKSLGQGGNETVFFTNAVSNQVFYAGVKSETQQGADFGFFAEITSNGPPVDGNNPVTNYGNVPVVIPDQAPGGAGASVFVPFQAAMTVRKIAFELGLEHPNPADLNGTLTSPSDQKATVNNYTASEYAGFTNFYDDLPDGSILGTVPTDFPGTFKNFIGSQATGMWIANETDIALLQTGVVTVAELVVYPQPQNPLDFIVTIQPFGWYYGYVDLPNDSTNLSIAVGFTGGGPVGIYITNQDSVNFSNYGVFPVPSPGGQLDVPNIASNIPVASTVNPPSPALTGGRQFYGIYNDSGAPLTVHVLITISESDTPNLILTEANNTPVSLQTDAHTQSQICLDSGFFTNNQSLVSLQVGIMLTDTNLDDLAINIISPQGTSIQLIQNRGGTIASGLGLTVTNANSTNASYEYTYFTDNTNISTSLIKFAIPPYAQPTTNTTLYAADFETNAIGDYGASNSFFPVLGTNLGMWTVTSNYAAVVNTSNSAYSAYTGTNYLALAAGQLTQVIPTVIGQAYSITYAYRGPGLINWWPFEGDAEDLIGTNNGVISGSTVNFLQQGQVGNCFQFNGLNDELNFGASSGNFGTNDFTIDYWINTTNASLTNQAVLEKRVNCLPGSTGWGIVMNPVAQGFPSGATLFYGEDSAGATGGVGATNQLNDGIWHHVAWTRKSVNFVSTYSIYIDGQLRGSSNYSGPAANLTNTAPMFMGKSICAPSIQFYSGAADELDLWNRALTDVEVTAIYEAGTNHVGKTTPVSILPNAEFLVNGATNSTIMAPASGTNWLTNIVYFTALSNTTTVVLQGNPLGMLFDGFQLIGPTNFNYVQPEQPLSTLIGENPLGCWTLDILDTRTDSLLPTNGVLLSWNMQMTVSSTNVNLIVITNHVPYTNGLVQANSIEYFAFDVPNNANYATNMLTNGSTNLTLFFNQTTLPTGNNLGDFALIANTNYGVYVLTNNAPPPGLVPGQRYFLGVLNTNPAPETFTLQIDTDTNYLVVTPLTNGVALATNILPSTNALSFNPNLFATNAPQYFSFAVPTNAILASFEIINPSQQLNLYVRHAAPLPSSLSYDYTASYDGNDDEAIVVTVASYNTNGVEVTTNSSPVPLSAGTWYAAVYDASAIGTTNTINYTILATFVTNSVVGNYGINIIPLTNQVPFLGTSTAGPALTNFYSFTITNAAPGVQFIVTNLTQNVDLIVRDGFLPTPQQMTAGSFNLGNQVEVITLVTNYSMPSLNGTWYLGVPDNGPTNISAFYTISASILTNITGRFNSPAVTFSAALIANPTNGFTMQWISVPGAQYEVDVTSDLSTWTFVSTVATTTTTGSYTDSTPINSQAARFYRVFRTQ
jgi:subtilisin-like proprotein convertase family protein